MRTKLKTGSRTGIEGEIIPSERQKAGVDNILSGKYPSKAKALEAAGYGKTGQHKPAVFLRSAGVQKYLKMLDKKSKEVYGMKLDEKVVEIYTKGLEATKLFGKNAKEHPDWMARKSFADTMANILGMKSGDPGPGDQNQYNFFMFGKQEKEEFNGAFAGFVRNYFKKSNT